MSSIILDKIRTRQLGLNGPHVSAIGLGDDGCVPSSTHISNRFVKLIERSIPITFAAIGVFYGSTDFHAAKPTA